MELVSNNGCQNSSMTMLYSGMMNWLIFTVYQYHHSCCKGQRMHNLSKASRIKSQQKLVLGCLCIHILLKRRENLIRPGMAKGGAFQGFF